MDDDPGRKIFRATHLGSKRVFYVEEADKIPSAEFTYVALLASELPAGEIITEGHVVHVGPWPPVDGVRAARPVPEPMQEPTPMKELVTEPVLEPVLDQPPLLDAPLGGDSAQAVAEDGTDVVLRNYEREDRG